MTQEEILQGNKLIAEFMGFHIWSDNSQMLPASMSHIKESQIAKYHEVWSRLMPVCIKLGFVFVPTDIVSCYNSVVLNIKNRVNEKPE